MGDSKPTLRSASIRLTIAIVGGALLGGLLVGLLGLIADSFELKVTLPSTWVWTTVGAIWGAIQAASHVGLHLHREWCEATIPHDHNHDH